MTSWTSRLLLPLLMVGLAWACGDEGEDSSFTAWGPGSVKTEVQPCDLLLTELMVTPSSPVTGRRWLEIFNASAETIDLSSVKVRIQKIGGKATEIDFRKGGPVTVPAGKFLWIRLGAQPLPEGVADGLVVYEYSKSVSIPDENVEIVIETYGKLAIHKVVFGAKGAPCVDGSALPFPAFEADQSIELQAAYFNCEAANSECPAWQAATQGAIPGDTGTGTPGQGPAPSVPAGRTPVPGEIVLSEVMYGGVDSNDWFELLNLSGDTLSLQGCSFGDGTASGTRKIDGAVSVCSGELALFVGKAIEGVDAVMTFASTPNLNSTGDRLFLQCPGEDGAAVTLFDVDFSQSKSTFPKPAKGVSIQVCPERLPAGATASDYHNSANWDVAPEGNPIGATGNTGTPGAPNPECGACATCTPCVTQCPAGSTCVLAGGEEVCVRPPAAAEVLLTEILSNAGDACSDGKDWIEVHNPGTDWLQLAGCKLGDETGETELKGQVLLPPGGFLVLAQTQQLMTGDGIALYGSTPNFNEDGDAVKLVCGGNAQFDLKYGTGGLPKPDDGPANEAGMIPRVASQLSMNPGVAVTAGFAANPANWCLATEAMPCGDVGTPGAANTSCGEPPKSCEPPCGSIFTCVTWQGNPTCARAPLPGEIIPTEIMTNAGAGCADGKFWFELFNLANDAVLLAGCAIADAGGSGTIKGNAMIPPKGHLVLVQAANPAFDAPNFFGYGTTPNLDKSGDALKLSCNGTELFALTFGSQAPIPAPKDKDGKRVAVQLKPSWGDPTLDYALNGANWQAACEPAACGDLSSPGLVNPTCP
ncbi:MAG: lamin tail domain-containing protein [Deltaproteobacteria bacterium]|nr:lamin tail domain-containing protein [Deltaproteobacteria bacterium]